MSRVACSLVLLAVVSAPARAADLPPGALARLGDDRFRTGGYVSHLALSPDGKQFATAHHTGPGLVALTVWDAETGRPVHEHAVNDKLFKGLVWGKGGAHAVAWRAEPGPPGKPAKILADDFRVWDFTDPKAAPPLVSPRVFIERVTATIHDVPSRSRPAYTDFLFSADGTRVAARWESADEKHAVHVFELKPADTAAKLNRVGTIDLGAEGAEAVRISADGETVVTFRTLANAGELTVTSWDVASGKPAKPVRATSAAGPGPSLARNESERIAHRLMLAPDGRSLVIHAAGEKEWGFDRIDINPFRKTRELIRLPYGPVGAHGHRPGERDGGASAFSASGGVLVVATQDHTTLVIDSFTGKELGRLEGHADTPDNVAVSADGTRIATADSLGLVRLWDAKTYRPVNDPPGHRAPVEHAELSPDGKRLLTWAPDETVRLWDVATGKELRAFAGATGDYQPVFVSGGTAVVYSNKKSLIARDLQTGLEVPLPDDAKELKPRAAILSTERLSEPVSGKDGEIRLYEAASGELRRTIRGHRGRACALGFTPDGSRLLTAGEDHTVLVWDMRLQAVPLPDAIKKETNAAKLWETLATGKADAAFLAMARISREPDAAVKLAKMRLKPAATGDDDTDATNLTDCRAVELLEALGTDEAKALLKELAAGEAKAFRTQEAKRALERIEAVGYNPKSK